MIIKVYNSLVIQEQRMLKIKQENRSNSQCEEPILNDLVTCLPDALEIIKIPEKSVGLKRLM